MQPTISKILYLHIPVRHPSSYPELEVPTLLQKPVAKATASVKKAPVKNRNAKKAKPDSSSSEFDSNEDSSDDDDVSAYKAPKKVEVIVKPKQAPKKEESSDDSDEAPKKEEVDIHLVSKALQASFSDRSHRTSESQDFQGIMNQLYVIMYEFNFYLPPDYALVIRALGSLEGTTKALDPDFKVIESAYPFVIGRLIADPSPDMIRILRELVIRNNGSIRWNRLERLVAAISEQASELTEDPNPEKFSSPSPWKLFDIHVVVDSTEDLLLFILSEKGHRVRLFLLRDMFSIIVSSLMCICCMHKETY